MRMNWTHIWDILSDKVSAALSFAFVAVWAYFESTYTFIIAFLFAFAINIVAGFRADEVKIKLARVFPPLMAFENFQGNKFKDALMEASLILFVVYALKSIIDLMKLEQGSYYAVQVMIGIAIYVYFRNSLRNLTKVYPKNVFFKVLYALLSFKLRDLFGDKIADIVEQEENKNHDKTTDNN